MHISSRSVGVIALSTVLSSRTVLAANPCPLINAYYPAPKDFGPKSSIANAVATLETQIEAALADGKLESNLTAFSVDVYSLHSEKSLFTYHYSPQLLASQRTSGVASVNSDTVYRIGSISKLLSVYTYLIAAGDESWSRPITDFVPELAAFAQEKKASDNEIDNVAWEDITVGALASQMSGIGRDAAWSFGLAQTLEKLGLKNQGGNSHSTCGDPLRSFLPCNRTQFFQDFPQQHPTAGAFQTPLYSNVAYQLLGYALESITNKSMAGHFEDSFVERLGLTGTYYSTPTSEEERAIIPFNTTYSWWDGEVLEETPGGGYFSTLNDMNKIGKAILNSTYLSPAQTRRWLKPHSFTSNPNYAVGAPWEIIRAPGAEAASWIYTKSGDLGKYSAMTGLLPELDAGFTILTAGEDTPYQARALTRIVTDVFAPALADKARAETRSVYGGTYRDPKTNSSITVATPVDGPGLQVQEYKVGGVDVVKMLGSLLKSSKMDIRLYPVGLKTNNASEKNGTAAATVSSWRAIFDSDNTLRVNEALGCASWFQANNYVYGGVGLDEFLFTLDAQGRALSLESRVVGAGFPKATDGYPVGERTTMVRS